MKKENKILKAILIFLGGTLLYVLLFGVTVYKEINNYKNNIYNSKIKTAEEITNTANEETETTYTANEEEIQNLFKIFSINYYETKDINIAIDNANNNILYKLKTTYGNISEEDFEEHMCGEFDLSTQTEYQFCGDGNPMINGHVATTKEEKIEAQKATKTKALSAYKLEKKFHELYGDDTKITHTSFPKYNHEFPSLEYAIISYQQNLEMYVPFNTSTGGTGAFIIDDYKKHEIKNDMLYIYSKAEEPANDPTNNEVKYYDLKYTFKLNNNTNKYYFIKIEVL